MTSVSARESCFVDVRCRRESGMSGPGHSILYNTLVSTRQIATSTLWQFASQLLMAALSIVTVKLVAVGLSQELAGAYNSAYGYLQIFGIIADFGLYAVAVREVSRAQDKERVLGALFILRTIILLLSLGAALLIAWAIPAWQGTPLPTGVTIAAFVPFFTLLAGMLRTTFQVHYQMHRVFIAEVTQRVVTVLLIAAIVLGWNLREAENLRAYEWMLAAGGIGAFVLFLLSYIPAQKLIRLRPRIDFPMIVPFLRLAAPYGVAFLCTALYQKFDITLIALLRSDFELQNAHYGFVQRIVEMGYLLPTFLLNSLLPLLAERDGRGESTRSLLGKTLLLILLLGAVSFLFTFLWPLPIMRLLTTEAYLATPDHPGSDTALRLLSFSMLTNGVVLYSFYVLLARHRWRPLVAILMFGSLLSLTLNITWIPAKGFMGAALTSVIVHGILATLLLPVSLRVLPASVTRSMFLRSGLFVILFGAILVSLAPLLTTIPTIVIGFAIAGVAMMTIAFALRLHRIML